jgi:hypothetical protein
VVETRGKGRRHEGDNTTRSFYLIFFFSCFKIVWFVDLIIPHGYAICSSMWAT